MGDRPLAGNQDLNGSVFACRDVWPTIRASWLNSLTDLLNRMATPAGSGLPGIAEGGLTLEFKGNGNGKGHRATGGLGTDSV